MVHYWKASIGNEFKLVQKITCLCRTVDHIESKTKTILLVSTAISDLRGEYIKPYMAAPLVLGSTNLGDGFIGQCITDSSIHSTSAMLFWRTLCLKNFSLCCICTHCYNTLPQAKRSRNDWPCGNQNNHGVISVCNALTNHQNQGVGYWLYRPVYLYWLLARLRNAQK